MKLTLDEARLGDTSLCKACGKPIEYISPYWRHTTYSPRHGAQPIDIDSLSGQLTEAANYCGQSVNDFIETAIRDRLAAVQAAMSEENSFG